MIFELLVVGPIEVNSIVIGDEKTKKGIVVDPGAEEEKILAAIRRHGLDIEYIFLTHGHYDHIGAVRGIKKVFNNAKVCIHKDEEKYIKDSKINLSEYRKQYVGESIAFCADILLGDGDIIKVEDLEFSVILLPGHTDASVCYYMEKEKKLIAGDTLFYHSVGTSDSYNGNPNDLLKNIEERLFVLPDDVIVYPGHSRETTIKEEKENNPYLTDSDTIDPWLI